LNGIAGAIAAGCDADDPFEGAGEMALVCKTRFQANVGDRQALQEETSGVVDPFLDDIGVGREPYGGAEYAEEVKSAQVRDVGEYAEGDVFGEMMVEIVE
jgi:hypothetical protein